MRWVVGFNQTIAIKNDSLPWSQQGFLLFILHLGHQTKWHASRLEFIRAPLPMAIRQVLACVRVAKQAGTRIEDGIEAGHEHPWWNVRMQDGIGLSQRRTGRNVSLDDRVHDAARRGHNQSGWYAVPSDITDNQPQPSICKGEEVVEVAADRSGGLIVRGNLP